MESVYAFLAKLYLGKVHYIPFKYILCEIKRSKLILKRLQNVIIIYVH